MVLVTGASGFLGSKLVQQLAADGTPVRALYHSTPPSAELTSLPAVDWQKCDLLDIYDVEEAMVGIDRVYHCAAIVSFHPAHHEAMLHFNPESTANIVNQALTQGIQKLVHVSSVAALGRSGDQQPQITEEQEWGESRYNSAYAISKYLAENEVWRGIGEGLCAVIVNPSVILGVGNWSKGSVGLMRLAWKEFPFYTGGINGWVDVDDVIAAMVLLMNNPIHAERYIISSGNHSYRHIFTHMATALGRKPPRIYAGPILTAIVARFMALRSAITGRQSSISGETARTAGSVSRYDNSKLLNTLSSFSYTPIEETIDRMAKAMKQQLNS